MSINGSHNGASIEGPGRIFWNNNGMVIVTLGQALVTGSDENTILRCLSRCDVTFVAGDGNNIANGNVGNDIFLGGAGYNRFYGGAGNDVLAGGSFINTLEGEDGNDTIFFGQNDQSGGGAGADSFVFVSKEDTGNVSYGDVYHGQEFAFIRDFNLREGDTLDLSLSPEISVDRMKVVDDTLLVFTNSGTTINFVGVGHQITMVGGIDAATRFGGLVVYDQFWPVGDLGTPEVTMVGIATTPTTGDHSVPVGGKG